MAATLMKEDDYEISQGPRCAALSGVGVPSYVIELLEKHIEELQRKGMLPKVKGIG